MARKDSSKFWSIVSRGMSLRSGDMDNQISSIEWQAHFSAIFSVAGSPVPLILDHELTVPLMDLLPPWEPVTSQEIKVLLCTAPDNKAPGPDMMPIEMFKQNPDWWCPILAQVFSYVNCKGDFPPSWKESTVVPIYKKGSKLDPKNYRPVSLLSVVSKLYTKFLLHKLETWAKENSIIAEEQAGFQQGKSTLDQCFVIHHLIQKYTQIGNRKLYTTFIDLTSAFDLVNRELLWLKLAGTNIDRRLLLLIKNLHTGTSLRVRLSQTGVLSERISTTRGVRQGCLLAPFLFNFYINHVVKTLQGTEFFPPAIGRRKLSVLLYADDIALFSITPIGLRRLLHRLNLFCTQERLAINHSKSKVLIFGRNRKRHKWLIGNTQIEQVNSFKYLGVTFSANLSWSPHLSSSKLKVDQSVQSLIHFMRSKGGNLVAPAIEVFVKKIIPQLLYGAQIWGHTQISSLESIQNKFIRVLLGVPSSTLSSLMRAEVGLIPIIAHCHTALALYWYKLVTMSSSCFPKLCFIEQMAFPALRSWASSVRPILESFSLSLDDFPSYISPRVKCLIKDSIRLYYMRHDLAVITNSPCSRWLLFYKTTFVYETYLTNLTNPVVRKAFSALRLQTMQSAVLEGRFKNTPYDRRLCMCNSGEVDDIAHYLLRCPLLESPRAKLFADNFTHFREKPTIELICWLLGDVNNEITFKVAKFALEAKIIRAKLLEDVCFIPPT